MLNSNVLVLNSGFVAIQITSLRRAVSLLYLGHVKVVDQDYRAYTFDEWLEYSKEFRYNKKDFIKSVKFTMKIPKVVVLQTFNRLPRAMVKYSRKNVFERDKYTCQYCGKKKPKGMSHSEWCKMLTIDHVVPRSAGGKSGWKNVVCACTACNHKKGDKSLDKLSNFSLIKEPYEPSWTYTITRKATNIDCSEWSQFLTAAG